MFGTSSTEGNMGIRLYEQPIAPTVEAIDAWRERSKGHSEPGDLHYGVNIWTKAGSCRCITSRGENAHGVYYWTIRGEGSSNGCRETYIYADRIYRAEATIVGDAEKINEALGEKVYA
jgi:cytochrome c2